MPYEKHLKLEYNTSTHHSNRRHPQGHQVSISIPACCVPTGAAFLYVPPNRSTLFRERR